MIWLILLLLMLVPTVHAADIGISGTGVITGVVPRTLAAGPGSPIGPVDTALYDQVQIDELSGPTTFSAPTQTIPAVKGQWLTYTIYTTVARALTWTTTANGFSAENGTALPTTSLAGSYIVIHYRWNTLSARWGAVWISTGSTPFVGTAGNLVSFATATTPGDSGIVAANVLTTTNVATVNNKRIIDRILPITSATTINVDCDDYDAVDVTAQATAATIAAPSTCTRFNGQSLTYRIFSAAVQTLGFDTTANGFSQENGVLFPTTTVANKYLVIKTSWNSNTNKWGLTQVSWQSQGVATLTETAGTMATIDCDTTNLARLASVSAVATLTIPNPACSPRDGQPLRISICSTATQTLSWGNEFTVPYGIDMPTALTGGGKCDIFGFLRHAGLSAWQLVATSQNPVPNRRRVCTLYLGNESGTMSDTDMVVTHGCPIYGAATIDQISVRSTGAGLPSVMVHRRTGTTNTPLLSSALAPNASGTVNCARTSAQTGLEGVACLGTLIGANATVTGGDVEVGATSGTANTATSMTINIVFIQ
jgi:hypothetical protein